MVSFPNFFMDAGSMSMPQLIWAFASYGYVLFISSGMISDGSELLLLIPSLAGMVGSIVLPILGAVPDGMMVLFSGMNPDVNEAQKEVAVGVGALAGSTIMLLTLPWFLAILAGRVDLDADGNCDYKGKLSGTKTGLTSTGVHLLPAIKENAKFMILTSMIYFVILIPALTIDKMDPTIDITGEARYEHKFALAGSFTCLTMFCVYLFLQYKAAQKVGTGSSDLEKKVTGVASSIQQFGLNFYILELRKQLEQKQGGLEAPLMDDFEVPGYMSSALRTIFDKYARGDGLIDRGEYEDVFRDLHIEPKAGWIEEKFNETDEDKSGYIEFKEFMKGFKKLVQDKEQIGRAARIETNQSRKECAQRKANPTGEEDDDEDEAEEIPEEWADLTPEEQKTKILARSFWLMGLGTLLVLIFSDPMVDVLSGFGTHTGISAFYISFVLAPMASNASELVAAYSYALKKTSKTITISMSTLEGAACMNNTFCLGIFFALIYVQGLAWRFTAETAVIVLVQVLVGIIAMTREVQTLGVGLVIISMYPASLVFVSVLEAFKLD